MTKAILIGNIPWIVLSLLNLLFFNISAHELTGVIFWYYLFSMVGLLIFPVTTHFFRKMPDGGYGLTRLLGLLVLFYLNWLGTYSGLFKISGPSLSFGLVLVIFSTHFLSRRENDLYDLMKRKASSIIKVEAIFFFLFTFYLVIHSLHPELYWGEKPMDFNLFNFSLRNDTLPMEDPWFAGKTMHYYYWGYYLFSGMAKMAGVQGEIGYALSLATSSALLGVALFSLLYYLCKKSWLALGGALLIPLASNLKAFWAIVFDKALFNMPFFWSSTRVFKNHAFAEYPSWSFLFADLHPHVMAYPFGVLMLCFLIYGIQEVWQDFKFKMDWGFFIFHALSYGVLLGLNGWDFILYTIFNSLFFLLSFSKIKNIKVWCSFFLVHLTSLILFAPMLLVLKGGRGTQWGFWAGETNSLLSHFSHHGHWWLICLFMVLPVYTIHRHGLRFKALFYSPGLRIFIVTFIIALTAEYFVFMDRVNTIFKTYNNIYIWGGILAMISLRHFKFYFRKKALIIFPLLSLVVINTVLLGTYFNVKAVTVSRPFGDVVSGLKGSQYLKKINNNDFKIIRWINNHVSGTPVLVERYSRSFDHRAARISMHTGVPIYLGWDNHVHLRGASWSEINRRKKQIDYIFNSVDPIKVYEFMLEKKLNFLVVGNLERQYYSSKGLSKFHQYQDIFKPLVTSGSSVLYGIGDFTQFIQP